MGFSCNAKVLTMKESAHAGSAAKSRMTKIAKRFMAGSSLVACLPQGRTLRMMESMVYPLNTVFTSAARDECLKSSVN
jgi:hypothetical protein